MRALIGGLALLAASGLTRPADAQTPSPAPSVADAVTPSSFIAPFPEGDVYRLQVWGDGLAEGLLGGLVDALGNEPRLQINRKHRVFQGLWRGDFEDDAKAIEAELAKDPPHIVVMFTGLVDRQPWRQPQRRPFNVGSAEWKAEYERRLDRVMRIFRRKSIGVYWVGHAIMRRQDVAEDAQLINEIVRERAFVNGHKFIDVYASFADEGGGFSSYGPDITGKIRQLREQDGSYYTPAGYRKIAHFAEREIKRDVTQAQSERVVPLAGAEAEQKRIRPSKDAAANPKAGAPVAAKDRRPGTDRSGSIQGSVPSSAGDLAADTTRVTLTNGISGAETVAIEIVRPAIPANVIALVTRREMTDKSGQLGDSVLTEILGGLTVVSSIAASGETQAGDKRKAATTSAPYYRVLVRGERLAPRPGRSDDMTWPRQETLPSAAAEQAPAQSPGQAPGPALPAARTGPKSPAAKAPASRG